MSYACQMQSLSSLNEFRMTKSQRPASKWLQMMRNCKAKRNYNLDTFCRETKRQFAFACRNTSVPEDHMRRGHSMTMKVTSHQYEHQVLKLLPVLTVAQQGEEIIGQRFQQGTSPVVLLYCLGFACQVVVRSSLVHFGVRGAKNDILADFTELVIFAAELIQDKELHALHRESRKVECFI